MTGRCSIGILPEGLKHTMVELNVRKAQVERAGAYLGSDLSAWQRQIDAESCRGGLSAYVPGVAGPFVRDGRIVVDPGWLDASYAALLAVRTRLLDELNLQDGLSALRAMEPLLRAIERTRDAHVQSRRTPRRGTTFGRRPSTWDSQSTEVGA